MVDRSPIQCLHRWTKILKPGLVKGPWSNDEDEKLLEWVKNNGPNKWSVCAENIPGRSGKQCRERWFNNLNPNVKKGNWTTEEDNLIFRGYLEHGSSWSRIAKELQGRTENSVKNRFYSTVRKLLSDVEGKNSHNNSNVIKPSEVSIQNIIRIHLSKDKTGNNEPNNQQQQLANQNNISNLLDNPKKTTTTIQIIGNNIQSLYAESGENLKVINVKALDQESIQNEDINADFDIKSKNNSQMENEAKSDMNENDEDSLKKRALKRREHEDYSSQNLLYRLLKDQGIPVKRTSCMKDYSMFYRKYKNNKYLSRKKQKENDKFKDLKKIIEEQYGNNQIIGNKIEQQSEFSNQDFSQNQQGNQQFLQQQIFNKQQFMNQQQQYKQFMQNQPQYQQLQQQPILQQEPLQLQQFQNNPIQQMESKIVEFFNKSISEIVKKFQTQFLSSTVPQMIQGGQGQPIDNTQFQIKIPTTQNLVNSAYNFVDKQPQFVQKDQQIQQQQNQQKPNTVNSNNNTQVQKNLKVYENSNEAYPLYQQVKKQGNNNNNNRNQNNNDAITKEQQQQQLQQQQQQFEDQQKQVQQQILIKQLQQQIQKQLTKQSLKQEQKSEKSSISQSMQELKEDSINSQQQQLLQPMQNIIRNNKRANHIITPPQSSLCLENICSQDSSSMISNLNLDHKNIKKNKPQNQLLIQQSNTSLMMGETIKNFKQNDEQDKKINQMLHSDLKTQILQHLSQQFKDKIQTCKNDVQANGGQNGEVDQKMIFLLQQLNTLESMLGSTKQELFRLEASLATPPENNKLTNIKDINNSGMINSSEQHEIGQINENNNQHDAKSNHSKSLQGFQKPNRKGSNTFSDFDRYLNGY